MQSLVKNKRGKLAPEQTVLLIIAEVVILSITGIVLGAKGVFTADFFSQTSCWLTNTAKCGGGFFSHFPSACRFNVIEEPIVMEEFSTKLTDTWWMFKEGACDFGAAIDETYFVYAIVPQEDISLEEYFAYSIAYKDGVKTDVTNSAYNYLEQNTGYQTLCFDIESEGIPDKKLVKDEYYYIIFYDDQDLIGDSDDDRILITTNENFEAENVDSLITGMAKLWALPQIFAAGIFFAPLTMGGSLAVAGGSAIFLLTDTSTEVTNQILLDTVLDEDPTYRGCLVYGPPLDESLIA